MIVERSEELLPEVSAFHKGVVDSADLPHPTSLAYAATVPAHRAISEMGYYADIGHAAGGKRGP